MIKLLVQILPVVFCISILSSCGGGSGGGSSSGSSSKSVLEGDTRNSNTGIRLLHGALDATPVDLISDQQTIPLTTSRFSLPAGFIGISRATQTISVVPTKKLSPILFQQQFSLASNEHTTVLLYGNNQSLGLRFTVIPDSRPAEVGSAAAIRIIHATNAALTLNGTIDGASLADSVPFGGASAYVLIPAGAHTITVSRSADSLRLFTRSTELQQGRSYSVFVTGEAGFHVTGRILED